jgi:hypothetical protein
MAEDRLGFEVQGVFYPHVMVDDYLLDSWALARRMMYPAPLEDWVNRKCDPMLYLSVYAAVDVYHARRADLSIDKILELFGGLRPDQVVPVGFDTVEVEVPDPPAEDASQTKPGVSSESSEPSPESDSEMSPPGDSGIPASPTGSEE